MECFDLRALLSIRSRKYLHVFPQANSFGQKLYLQDSMDNNVRKSKPPYGYLHREMK